MHCLFSIVTLIVFASADSNQLSDQRSEPSCNTKEWTDLVNYIEPADRVYYIACVEEEWDYCPSGKNLVTGEDIVPGTAAATWCLGDGARVIGPKYMKSLYREFDDICFDHQKERSDRDKHLGLLGPSIRALTGETIKVFYQNKCSFPNSMHPHGLKYDKTSEGAAYFDDGLDGDVIAPGENWVYIWEAREQISAGLSSQMWLYHSHVDEPRDVLTGLFGGIIVTEKGMETSSSNLMPRDIDREFTTFMVEFYEEQSLLFADNLEKYLGLSIDDHGADMLLDNAEFKESNLMHSINGYVFGNLQHLDAKEGEEVRWYTASLGSEVDGPHSPHWHGNIVANVAGDYVDTVQLIPGMTETVTMAMDSPGVWLYHCHVHDHIDAGMYTMYDVAAADPSVKETEKKQEKEKFNKEKELAVDNTWKRIF